MTDPIANIERIQAEASAAALTHSDINDACPYPWGSGAGRIFKQAFHRARAQRGGYCACAVEVTEQELDTLQCQACGLRIVA